MEKNMSFESAYNKLEKILDKINDDKISLEDSLSLYEEADKLINFCTKSLNNAEKKIQVLIKKDKSVETNEAKDVLMENYENKNN